MRVDLRSERRESTSSVLYSSKILLECCIRGSAFLAPLPSLRRGRSMAWYNQSSIFRVRVCHDECCATVINTLLEIVSSVWLHRNVQLSAIASSSRIGRVLNTERQARRRTGSLPCKNLGADSWGGVETLELLPHISQKIVILVLAAWSDGWCWPLVSSLGPATRS